jgi:hypothetical protein
VILRLLRSEAPGRARLAFLCVLLARMLCACGALETYPGAERPDAEVATVRGFFRDYVVYGEQSEIFSVDGRRTPSGVSASAVRFLPGRHWIAVSEDRYSWGDLRLFCAIEQDFLAGHVYKLKARSKAPEVSWLQAWPDLYRSSITLEVSAPGMADQTMEVAAVCSNRYWVCRQDADCTYDRQPVCRPEPAFGYGVCEKRSP